MTSKLKITPNQNANIAIQELRDMANGNRIDSKSGINALSVLVDNGATIIEDINSFNEPIFILDIKEEMNSSNLLQLKEMTDEAKNIVTPLEAVRLQEWNNKSTNTAYIKGQKVSDIFAA